MDKLQKKVKHNFFIGYNMIFKQKISVHAKLVYLYLCRCADGNDCSFPSYSTIGENCSVSRRTAIEAVKELEAIGLVFKQIQKTKKGGDTSNLYTVTDCPSAGDAPPPVQEMHPPGAGDAPPRCRRCTPPVQEMHPNYTNISTTQLSTHKSSQGQSQTDKDTDGDIDFVQEVEAVKEKEPLTVPTSRGSISNNAQDKGAQIPPKPTTEEAQAQYEAAQQQLEIVKDNIEYGYIEDDYYRESVDSLLASMEEVFLSKESTVKIGKADMPRQAVISTYLKLTRDHFDHVLDRFKTVRNPITHVHAYLKTCLYRAYQELDPHMRNLVTQHYGY